jgi:ATP-dependent 26S proteasome regulatory subunit
MGATNRYEILDPALTRPGRFDRLVRVSLPDEAGRAAVLRVHTRKLKLDPDVDLWAVAEATPDYSGAELAALSNEAAIRAVRRNSETVNLADFMGAVSTFSSTRKRGIAQVAIDSLPNWWPGQPQPPK